MIKNLMMILAGFVLGTVISTASAALFESKSHDAKPIVGYGKNGTTIVAIKVAADGTLQ